MNSISNQLVQATDVLLDRKSTKPALGWKIPSSFQVTKKFSTLLCGSVFMATTLFSANAISAQQPWQVDAALLFYSETDRVTAFEPVVSFKKKDANDDSINIKIALDSLTGASPTGAVASPQAVTYTRPSGAGSYITPANEIPLDDTFKDTRVAVKASWLTNTAEDVERTLGVGFSNEYDYTSISGNAGYSFTFDGGNSDLSFGTSLAYDTIRPVGGAPVPGECMVGSSQAVNCNNNLYASQKGADETKLVIDILLGYTKTVNRTTLFQTGLSLSSASGYLNDPYKLVSIVDSDNSQQNGIGVAERHNYESRPDSRLKTAIYARVKTWLAGDVLDASYRLLSDDWGLLSHTLDARYRFAMASWYIQPRLRYYLQESIDYYRYYLLDVADLPAYYTADDRLGSFNAVTLGLEFGQNPTSDSRTLRYAIEAYTQTHKARAEELIGALSSVPSTNDLQAIILRANYQF